MPKYLFYVCIFIWLQSGGFLFVVVCFILFACVFLLNIVYFIFLFFGDLNFVLDFSFFFEKRASSRVGIKGDRIWRNLEERNNIIKIYSNFKIVLNNEKSNN